MIKYIYISNLILNIPRLFFIKFTIDKLINKISYDKNDNLLNIKFKVHGIV